MVNKAVYINVAQLYRCGSCWWWDEVLQDDRVNRWSHPGVITWPWENWPLLAHSHR